MNFYILTLFPQMVEEGLNTSIIGRAKEAGILHIETVNIRDYSANKHHKVDDYPYGGGAGMLMLFESMLRPQGALNQILQMYFNGICG